VDDLEKIMAQNLISSPLQQERTSEFLLRGTLNELERRQKKKKITKFKERKDWHWTYSLGGFLVRFKNARKFT